MIDPSDGFCAAAFPDERFSLNDLLAFLAVGPILRLKVGLQPLFPFARCRQFGQSRLQVRPGRRVRGRLGQETHYRVVDSYQHAVTEAGHLDP